MKPKRLVYSLLHVYLFYPFRYSIVIVHQAFTDCHLCSERFRLNIEKKIILEMDLNKIKHMYYTNNIAAATLHTKITAF